MIPLYSRVQMVTRQEPTRDSRTRSGIRLRDTEVYQVVVGEGEEQTVQAEYSGSWSAAKAHCFSDGWNQAMETWE